MHYIPIRYINAGFIYWFIKKKSFISLFYFIVFLFSRCFYAHNKILYISLTRRSTAVTVKSKGDEKFGLVVIENRKCSGCLLNIFFIFFNDLHFGYFLHNVYCNEAFSIVSDQMLEKAVSTFNDVLKKVSFYL